MRSGFSAITGCAPRAPASYGLHATTFYRSIWDLCATDPSVLRVETWEGTIELMISAGRLRPSSSSTVISRALSIT